jgi:hypothetical protein
MSIIETHIPNQDVKLNVKNVKYPQTRDPNSPQNFFCAAFAGSRGSGKTYLSCKLIKSLHDKKVYDGDRVVPQRVILISPSAHSPSNNVFKTLNIDWENDVYEEYSDKILDEIVAVLVKDQEEAKKNKQYVKAYIRFQNVSNIDDLAVDDLMLLYNHDFTPPDEIPKPTWPDSFYTIIILDDVLGTSALRQGRSRLTYYMLKNRHTAGGINFIVNIQNLMSVPKSIRINLNFLAIFRFANKEVVLNDLAPLISATTTLDEFDKLYTHATKNNQHDALIIDLTKSKVQFKRNLDTLLELKK